MPRTKRPRQARRNSAETDGVPGTCLSDTPTRWRARARARAREAEGEGSASAECPRLHAASMHLDAPPTLWCREKEVDAIKTFLVSHLSERRPGSLYISGTPGTGKTACLQRVLDDMKENVGGAQVISLNCMQVDEKSLYATMASHLEAVGQNIEEYICSGRDEMIILVLDEVDQLKVEALYSIFEWPTLKKSRLILIGIANTLDLITRCLPRLVSFGAEPQQVLFPAYTKSQIEVILAQRLQERGVAKGTVVRPMAITYVAGKVAALKGDIRNALDLCRRAMELCTGTAVTVQDIIKALPRNKSSLLPELQFQHKLVLCSALLLGRAKCKSPSLAQLYGEYSRLCSKAKLSHMQEREMLHVADLLEASNMISKVKTNKAAPRYSTVSLAVGEEELVSALRGEPQLGALLQ